MPETNFSKNVPSPAGTRLPETQRRFKSGAEELFQGAGVKATQTKPEFIFGTTDISKIDSNQTQISTPSETIDATGIEFGDLIPEFQYQDIASSNELFKDLDNDLEEANNIVTNLRLKGVGYIPLTDADELILALKQDFISRTLIERADLAKKEEAIRKEAEMKQQEAEAQNLVAKAEALLSNISLDNTSSLESICAELEALAQKLGPDNAVTAKIDLIIAKIKNLSQTKEEVKAV